MKYNSLLLEGILKFSWIFFDVGSTLVDETVAYDHRAIEMLFDSDISFADFDKRRIELAKEGLDGNSAAIEFFGLTKTPWHSEDEVLFCDAKVTLEALKSRGYKIGIIANQNEGLEERLRSFGIFEYFDLVVSSAEIGAAKPDKLIFEKALAMAGCAPCEALMVGDRLDNDIFPAKALGMGTAWIKSGLAAHQDDGFALGKADFIVGNLADLPEILK